MRRWVKLGFPAVLLAGLCFFAFWYRQPSQVDSGTLQESSTKVAPPATTAESSSQSPSTPSESRSSISLAKADISTLLASYSKLYESSIAKGVRRMNTPRFALEEVTRIREGRLLALAYPEVVEGEASQAVLNRALSTHVRTYFIHLLGVLAKTGRSTAEQVLLQVASSEELIPSENAIWQLSEADDRGTNRGFYLQKAMADSRRAMDALSYWPDSASVAYLRDVVNKGEADPASAKPTHHDVKYALARLDFLNASDWQKTLQNAITDPSFRSGGEAVWAMRAARLRGLPTLESDLRKRISTVAEEAREYRVVRASSAANGIAAFEQDYISKSSVDGISDRYHDEALIELAQIGGKLSDLEQRRLRMAGYACNPSERLAELLAQKH